jgi:hypothetical protein
VRRSEQIDGRGKNRENEKYGEILVLRQNRGSLVLESRLWNEAVGSLAAARPGRRIMHFESEPLRLQRGRP